MQKFHTLVITSATPSNNKGFSEYAIGEGDELEEGSGSKRANGVEYRFRRTNLYELLDIWVAEYH